MDNPRPVRGRAPALSEGRRPQSRNKTWLAGDQGSSGARSGTSTPPVQGADAERWERGGYRGGRGRGVSIRGRGQRGGRRFPNASLATPTSERIQDDAMTVEGDEGTQEEEDELEVEEPELNTPEERERFYQELVKAREVERKHAIAEGKMDDPLVPKRLEDAITMVGTCVDMCPRFERYRRERENNLFEWETIPGTKRVDHSRAVKMYERAAGDKTLPSDLRPPEILKSTLDYLFHDLLPRGGFAETHTFVRDRSRAVRNDLTMQHDTGPLAIECHDRCARFHILALHIMRDRKDFSVALEEQQLMNTLQSLKEFYEDQRGRYDSPTELEMRVYHRLIHIRDQKERHEDLPTTLTSHPVFKLTTAFRLQVQANSAPISKTSKLVVGEDGMRIFEELAEVLRRNGRRVMVYLVACLLERLFGKECIEDLEAIRGDMELQQIIDGTSGVEEGDGEDEMLYTPTTSELRPSASEWLSDNFGPRPTASAIFGLRPSETPPSTSIAPASTTFSGATTPNSDMNSSPFTNPRPINGWSAFTNSNAATASSSPFSNSDNLKPESGTGAFSNLKTSPNVFGPPGGFAASTFSTTPRDSPRSAFGVTPEPREPATAASSSSLMPQSNTFSSASTFSASSHFDTSPFTRGGVASFSGGKLDASPFSKPTPMFEGSSSSQGVSNVGLGLFNNGQNIAAVQQPQLQPAHTLNPEAPMFTPLSRPSDGGSQSAPLDAIPVSRTTPSVPTPSAPTPPAPQPTLQPQIPPTENSTAPPKVPTTWGAPTTNAATLAPRLNTKSPPSLPRINTNSPPNVPRISTDTPPTLPRINTNTSSNSQSSFAFSSPLAPPPLQRPQPISLPTTPSTATTPTLGNSPRPPPLSFAKKSLLASAPLSPIDLPTPTTSRPLKSVPGVNGSIEPLAVPTKLFTNQPGSPALINGKGKGKASMVDIGALALDFSRKGLLVKECFHRWMQRTTDRAEWLEACQHSDTYSQKVKRQRLSGNGRKRRADFGSIRLQGIQKKRTKRRVSSEYKPPRTDEELARRFRENHEENERRWAQGSFLQVICAYVRKKTNDTIPHAWRTWLSMNPVSDGTAIWMERKFDVPASGQWESESIFSIPLSPEFSASPSPGIIIFECTPLEDVTDELERKYRVLDDCSRLQDIVKSLPLDRHFIPSIMAFCWLESDRKNTSPDFLEMLSKLKEEGIIQNHLLFPITSTTKDLDRKFEDGLDTLELDVQGKLVEIVTIQGIFKLLEQPWREFTSEWIESYSSHGDCDWVLLGKALGACVNMLNGIVSYVIGTLAANSTIDPLPELDPYPMVDSDSTYDNILSWLSNSAFDRTTVNISQDLESHRNMGRDFPPLILLGHLRDLVLHRIHITVGKPPNTLFSIPKTYVSSALSQLRLDIQPQMTKMQQAKAFRVPRTPKRGTPSVDSESSRHTNGAKRPKLWAENDSSQSDDFITPTSSPRVNGRLSPSPSSSSVLTSEEPSHVTIAMLRALTKNVKQKYGGN